MRSGARSPTARPPGLDRERPSRSVQLRDGITAITASQRRKPQGCPDRHVRPATAHNASTGVFRTTWRPDLSRHVRTLMKITPVSAGSLPTLWNRHSGLSTDRPSLRGLAARRGPRDLAQSCFVDHVEPGARWAHAPERHPRSRPSVGPAGPAIPRWIGPASRRFAGPADLPRAVGIFLLAWSYPLVAPDDDEVPRCGGGYPIDIKNAERAFGDQRMPYMNRIVPRRAAASALPNPSALSST